jgi:ferredoxin
MFLDLSQGININNESYLRCDKKEAVMKRNVITIDRDKCDGCGLCIPNCPEGAIRIINSKACLVSDLFCDGLGACIGRCPQGAITIEQREAMEYSEREVMKNMVKHGSDVITAHLEHLKNHGQNKYYNEAVDFLDEHGIDVQAEKKETAMRHNCPGSNSCRIERLELPEESQQLPSQLRQWPIQFNLISPDAEYFKDSDLLIAADCVAYSLGDFHGKWLKGKTLVIACPKLDLNKEEYMDKLVAFIYKADISSLTIMVMEVPCCGGLLRLAQNAMKKANRKISMKSVVVGIDGNIINEDML